MARDRYFLCGTFCLCACFFMVNGITKSAFNNENYYSTDSSHHRIEHSLYIDLLKDSELHNHQKREVESPQMASSTPAAAVTVDSSGKVINSWKLPQDTATKLPENYPTKPNIIHNLGVNGTGQRKNITVVKQHPNLVHNISASVNTPLKITSFEDLGDPLTPDDVGVGDELDKNDLADNNITSFKTDTHIFYNSTTYNDPDVGKSFWVDMENGKNVKVNDLLSNSHRRAATIKLSFEFPFYGHYIKNVTIATGGFLYTGNYVHSWLAATQFVAPLMANFDTSRSNNSWVKFVDNETAFTVEWEKVVLQDKPDKGEFTFQVTLHKNGDIVFVYKNVPILIKDINDQMHPVKVGLSDAYILDRTVFYVRRKTIYEYHRVTFKKEEVKNWTSIYLKALPTCLDLHNCSSCLLSELSLNCTWCPKLNQCSTGQDRNRQYWIDNGCEERNITSETMCSSEDTIVYVNHSLNYDIEDAAKSFDDDYIGQMPQQRELGASGYIAIVFLIAMISGFGFWMIYAYRNPHTASGQMLIRVITGEYRFMTAEQCCQKFVALKQLSDCAPTVPTSMPELSEYHSLAPPRVCSAQDLGVRKTAQFSIYNCGII